MGISLIIGDCGSGKSVEGARMCAKYMKKGYKVYSNLYLQGAYKFDLSDLMNYDFGENSVLFIDEAASHGLGSRGSMYKNTITTNIVEFMTMYRHYKVKEIIIVSPSFADVIPVVRDNATNIIVVKKSIFNLLGFNKIRRIWKKVDIKEGEPKMVYDFIFLSTRLHFRQHIFKLYDSYTRKELNKKEFIAWYQEDINNVVNEENEEKLSLIEKIFKKKYKVDKEVIEDIEEDRISEV